jgi:hypothetical protein
MTDVRIPPSAPPAPEAGPAENRFVPDLAEHGGPVRGVPQQLDTRLFLQLSVFTGCTDLAPVVRAVRDSGVEAVVYADLNDPYGVGVLAMAEDPAVFTGPGRDVFHQAPFTGLTPRADLGMIGRTYGTGRESDLEDWLLHKPRRNALDPAHRWAIWYPLRRFGAFNRLPRGEQGRIMGEHALIGRAYGEIGKAVDVRLECHGLDRNDNEFLLGIIGPALYPLSKLIKDMRGTRQTSEFIQSMGPFFVGRAAYQSPIPERSRR